MPYWATTWRTSLLHATAACLVIAILRRLSLPGAWLAGFLFALHPVCVEAVAWISEQKSTLSAVLYLGAALAYLHFDQTRSKRKYLLATGLFVLALLSKTVTATLPAALLVVLWWKRGRLDWRRDARPLLPWLALGACAGIFTAWMERTSIGAQGPDFALTLAARFLLAGRAICFYAGKLLWPAGLMFTYPRWTLDPREWWQYLFPAGVVAVAIALCAGCPPPPRAVGRISLLRRNAVSRARLPECLSFSVFLRRRPLPIPGKPGDHRSGRLRAGDGRPAGLARRFASPRICAAAAF